MTIFEMRIGSLGIEFHPDYVVFRELKPEAGPYKMPFEATARYSDILAFELGPFSLDLQIGPTWRSMSLGREFHGRQEELRILAKQLREKLWG